MTAAKKENTGGEAGGCRKAFPSGAGGKAADGADGKCREGNAALRERAASSETAMEAANAQLTAFQDSLTGGKEEKDMLMEEITQKKNCAFFHRQNVYSMEEKPLRLQEEQNALRTEQKKSRGAGGTV